MDYIEKFMTLKNNSKYGRKSPLKAVLLLAVIEMYETGEITSNEIVYNEQLKNCFDNFWNKLLSTETESWQGAYLAFWYLQKEDFWHIVPKKHEEDILDLMQNDKINPSEDKIKKCVRFAELDNDLYFLMTLKSGRSSLKRALLETYFTLSEGDIDKLSASVNNKKDNSTSAINEYKEMLKSREIDDNARRDLSNQTAQEIFEALPLDIKIAFNYEYYSFLKKQRIDRDAILEICPTVYDLYDRVTRHHVMKGDLPTLTEITYENLLQDLKISMMSEDTGMDIIDSISSAIEELADKETVQDTIDKTFVTDTVSPVMEIETRSQPIESTTQQYLQLYDDIEDDYSVENLYDKCYVLNRYGERVFSTDGSLKVINGNIYRFNLKPICLTVKRLECNDGKWSKSGKMLVAYCSSDLFTQIDSNNYLDSIEDFREGDDITDNKIKFNGVWYNYNGSDINRITTPQPTVRRTTTRWTMAQDKELQVLYKQGMTVQQLADYYNRDMENILKRLNQKGLV